MKILVCGSRDWTNVNIIRRELEKYSSLIVPGEEEKTIIHGAATGADSIAGAVGTQLGFCVRSYPAPCDEYRARGNPRAAGPVRNSEMLRKEHPDFDGIPIDLCLAFTKNLERSRGTKDMVLKARKAGIKTIVIGE